MLLQVDIISLQERLLNSIFEKLFESEYLINGEAYISSAYELMLQDGLNVGLYNIEHFFLMGNS